jgi:preprotein translocase subunit SecE
VARNRKRAKDRRARRPQPVGGSSAGSLNGGEDALDPLAHAAPDVELAEAQLALGRPELVPETPAEHEVNETELEAEAEVGAEAEPYEIDDRVGAELAISGHDGAESEHESHVPAVRPHIGGRLVGFLQGSWRELQRVQWPDRRQVMQATGVVLGFVIVAGVFLGVSDYLAGKLMDYILK